MKVIVRGPALTRTGYGEHCRFVLRSLRQCEDLDIYLLPVNWGQSSWIWEENEERSWLDEIIKKTALYQQQGGGYDVSVQVTIPNEWAPMAPVNIGVTAGIETTKVAPVWLEKANQMDKIITISKHSKESFLNSVYDGINRHTGEKINLKCTKEVEIVHYPVKDFESINLDLDLQTKFNFLTIAQWGPRKNILNTIAWFVEEFIDNSDVGLVVKTFGKGGSIIDRAAITKNLNNLLKKYEDRKCKVYLLHGDMSEQEIHSLYTHENIHCFVSLTHGEGFGLPLFEAAYSGMPVLAPDWSGHLDFLYMPVKDKKGKARLRPKFAKVDYDLQPVQPEAVWDGVLQADSLWAFAQQGSYKMKLREAYKQHGRYKKQSKALKEWILKEFAAEKQHHRFLQKALNLNLNKVSVEEIPKISIITSVYNGDEYIRPFLEDITRQTIFKEKCELILINANSPGKEEETIKEYVDKFPNNIVYKKLDTDPGIYGVWNLGIEISSGEYITNANLDDRKAINALEKLAKELYNYPEIDLVYSDMLITDKPNETWENNSAANRRYNFPEFSYENLKMVNMPHAAPMWRKSLHQKHGLFEDKYRSAGDWEMWLRAASKGAKYKKFKTPLGLYYFNPTGISTNPENFSWKREEEGEIYEKYKDISLA